MHCLIGASQGRKENDAADVQGIFLRKKTSNQDCRGRKALYLLGHEHLQGGPVKVGRVPCLAEFEMEDASSHVCYLEIFLT